jgi:hypothetical protein
MSGNFKATGRVTLRGMAIQRLSTDGEVIIDHKGIPVTRGWKVAMPLNP